MVRTTQTGSRRRVTWVCPRGVVLLLLIGWGLGIGATSRGATLDSVRQEFLAGRYAECVVVAEKAWESSSDEQDWHRLLIESLSALGRYEEAYRALTNAMARQPRSIRVLWAGRPVLQMNGLPDQAAAWTKAITEAISTRPWAYRDAADLVVFGQAALLEGADPRRVLDRVFETAKRLEPKLRDVYLASGGLALDKSDFALAAKTFQAGLKVLPDDPDLHWGLARAYESSEKTLMAASLEAALNINSNHVPSLLLLAEHAITAEDYEQAETLLDRVRGVNPWHPEAWAYAAVLAHLRNLRGREEAAIEMALKHWPTNPRVPHLIGRKLSQDYRFAEGAAFQRQALRFDPEYLPAKAQLAQDLLRLGEDDEGWRLAEEVHDADGYDVAALNLVTLRDALARFVVLTNEHFTVRMTPHEAALYGPRALELLAEARAKLTAKYGLEPARPVRVEIFAEQKDFAVRTFGMPENHGFLGVCFGHVITANSPGSRAGQSFNWESMLWHEFTHVITLQLTRNKMPRWLSEGISVYEERQANPAWGERLVPKYRELILEDELTPVSQLSRAFMSPPSAMHLQFAYYQSSLVVEFLIERYGAAKLAAILRDLGEGLAINQAIEKHTAPLAEIEPAFTAYARQIAESLAPGLDWEKPELDAFLAGGGETAWELWAKTRPTNFYVLTRRAARAMEEQQWAEARPLLEQLLALYPGFTGSESAYRSLALVQRELGDVAGERQSWGRLAERDGEAVDAYLRLMELASEAEDWPGVRENAGRYLAVNPLVPAPYRYLAKAAEALSDRPAAIRAYRALLALDPVNPAEVHYRLARQLHAMGDPAARRHVLRALEEAPRFRDALTLLLEMGPATENPSPPPTVAAPEANHPPTAAAPHRGRPAPPGAAP